MVRTATPSDGSWPCPPRRDGKDVALDLMNEVSVTDEKYRPPLVVDSHLHDCRIKCQLIRIDLFSGFSFHDIRTWSIGSRQWPVVAHMNHGDMFVLCIPVFGSALHAARMELLLEPTRLSAELVPGDTPAWRARGWRKLWVESPVFG